MRNIFAKKRPISKEVTFRLAIVIVGVNLAMLYFIGVYFRLALYDVKTDYLNEIVNNVGNHVVTTLEKYEEVTRVVAESTAISNLMMLSDKENPMHKQEITDEVVEQLKRITENFDGDVINFGLLDLEQDGYLTNTGDFSKEDFSFKDRSYYTCITKQQTVITSPYYDHLTGEMVLTVASPVIRDGEVLGAVIIDLTTAFISEMIIESNQGETGSSIVFDDKNIILGYDEPTNIGKHFDILGLNEDVLKEIQNPSNNLISYYKSEVKKTGIVGSIEGLDWKILTFMDTYEFENDLVKLLAGLIIFLIMFTAISLKMLDFSIKDLLKPLEEIKYAMNELAKGNVKYFLKYKSNNEIGDLADDVRIATQNLSLYIDKMQHQLDYDELTGLHSESKFIKEAGKILFKNPEKKFAILTFDIDNFKYINETYGYKTGTKLLKVIAEELTKENNIFKFDDIVTRNYGDHFTLLLEENTLYQFEEKVKEKYIFFEKVALQLLGEYYELSVSVGIYKIQDIKKDVSWMMDCASYARIQAKKEHGFSVSYYSDDIHNRLKNKNYITTKMQEAIDKNEFIIYYQSKFDFNTKKIVGAEALVRWFHNGEIIRPDDFIPVFEHNGFIETLDYYIVDAVCQMLKNQDAPNMPVVSINLSGITMMKTDVVEKVCAILEKNNVKTSQIELEITESAVVEHFEVANDRIDRFREYGFRVSMDDFGSGISSLGRLKNMTIDILKIDREFIIDSFSNPKAAKIIAHVVDMAKNLGLKTVVEGVETEEQLKFLREIGCDIGQGYIFSRPVPIKDFLNQLKDDE